jgi:hypothetical protein
MQESKTKDTAYNVISESSVLFYIFYLNHTADRVRIGKKSITQQHHIMEKTKHVRLQNIPPSRTSWNWPRPAFTVTSQWPFPCNSGLPQVFSLKHACPMLADT